MGTVLEQEDVLVLLRQIDCTSIYGVSQGNWSKAFRAVKLVKHIISPFTLVYKMLLWP